MELPRESDPALPSPEELLHRRRAVGIQLSHWRLLLCTGPLPYGLLMLAQLLDSPDGEPPWPRGCRG